MKKINLLALLAVISVIIVGCFNTGNKDKVNETLIDLSSVNSITIQNDSGESMTITDNNLIEQFNEAIHTAEYDSAKLDIAAPDYEATVEMKNNENEKFSFWIKGENSGLFTKSGQNGHYKLPETKKVVLLDLFQPNEQQVEADNLKIDEEIKRITIAKSLAHGSVSANIKAEYIDHESIETFVRAIRTAVQIPGNLNTATPNYDIVLISNNNKYAFHLWINETSEQGMLMNVNETSTGYTLTKESTIELKKLIFLEANFKGLEFNAVRSSNGELVAKPIGITENNYLLNGGAVVELQGILYHTIHFFYGDHNAVNALLAHDPATDEVMVKWSDELIDTDNRWNNAFMNNYNMLIKLDEDHLLFLESDLTKEAGKYHLSSYNVVTGDIERLREDFWPLSDDSDYIYKFQWNADEQILFMQSYLGNVWLFDLRKGKDDVHLLKYPVIPHSTTGAPSLFLSPTFKRFVHDDESGQLTFYDNKGASLRTVALPQEQYVPSEKIKWNPAGTIAWMDTAEMNQNRIHDIDIDYLKIAPQKIDFYNQDGLPIGSIKTESDQEDAAVEVVGWMDANVAVIKSYSVELLYKDTIGLKVKNVSYYLYDVKKKQKGASFSSIPAKATVILDHRLDDADNEGNITVSFKEITYKKGN
ncbi:hypothetical protein NSQ90_14690 [Paenibacillus sp. FSL H7-0737]|uniref:hypothetical protein n=1 Tax=Paenibacillus sp. FSL H7-0737 TaxID=1536775 RepID=UPI0004F5913F|nr:hypothetical protein [Paenibacillus sp. FSL H7-0737]AIQ24021.1 hypothetical protein H70737_14815 [Paenibacillus sp. FSL H7-0737]